MSEFGEAVNVVVSPPENETLHGCKWSSCKKQHKQQLQYPSKGQIKKGGGYRAAWITAGMQPWDPKTFGQGRKRLREDGGDYATMTYEYKTQGHHLVPTSLLEQTSTLKDNLVLVDYDGDGVENGMMLPQFLMDIPLHQLQAHDGNHPSGYMNPIRTRIERLEQEADGICSLDTDGTLVPQKAIAEAIVALAHTARAKILAIRTGKGFWPVRTDALNEYNHALQEYARRERLHAEKLRSQHVPHASGDNT
ncbi:AHH domain-containing protein [Corallococcus llansteffanensis]|uniref:Uncharacterized protein n=1 Tax=Corallococcus llansteffanensis TaxID=2316731 RepID=A0A3A8PHY8_9BACT|nr:AHH domain-containing protein [Corallococcus llansteffanensis]RKH55958.1 hypothetical protein D7V93_21415 [Corallococcus llansteffanensis]